MSWLALSDISTSIKPTQNRKTGHQISAKIENEQPASEIGHLSWHFSCSFILKPMDFNSQPDTAVRPSDAIEFKALLLVDDDKQLASALQWILADENFLVDVANDGDEALVKVKANEYDAVVCDVMMPKLRGDEFYIRARELRPVLADRFIFITGFAADPKINLFLTQTDSKYLMKPFPIQHLINCLKELLE